MTFDEKCREETRKQIMWGLGWIARDTMSKSEPKRNKRRVLEVSKSDFDRVVNAKFEYVTTGKRRLVTVTPLNGKGL